MAKRRKVGNLMALAVLSVLAHRPMHPYEMAGALRGWSKDRDMPIKWGSLYSVVQRMADRGLIEAAGTTREGNRPERTVYRITDEGRDELVDWARELLSVAEREDSRFRSGLSVMMILPPGEAAGLLRRRAESLDAQIASARQNLETALAEIPRLFLIEEEYELAVTEAEAAWVRSLLEEIENGTFPGIDDWRRFHEQGEMPADIAALAERNIDGGHR